MGFWPLTSYPLPSLHGRGAKVICIGYNINLSIIVWIIIISTTSYLASTYLNKVWDNLKPLNKDTLEKMPKWFKQQNCWRKWRSQNHLHHEHGSLWW
jgi:hypothetical protein